MVFTSFFDPYYLVVLFLCYDATKFFFFVFTTNPLKISATGSASMFWCLVLDSRRLFRIASLYAFDGFSFRLFLNPRQDDFRGP